MPTYEYACDGCGNEFEREQRISDEPIKTCPSCKAPKVRRLISRTSFVLKGGGWYRDLYSGPKPAKAESPEGKEAAPDKKPAAEPSSDKSDKKTSPADRNGAGSDKKAVA